MADGLVPVVVSPVPFSRQIHDLTVREGATVLAMLVEAVRSGKLASADLSRTTIYVDGERLKREEALETVLSGGQIINVVVEPLGGGGGGGKDIGQIVLTIAVIVASAWVGGPTGPLAAMSALVRTVASAAVMAVGQAAIGALFAPDRDAQAKANDRYALQSASNQYRPWSPFPMALGEVIVAPDLAVKTFTQSRGDDVWIYGILSPHFGACEVSEVKIGDTLASTMGPGDAQFVYHLTPGPRTFQLYPNDVDQLDLTEELEATTSSGTPVTRAGSAEGEKFEFDFFLPGGLHFQKDDGRVLTASVTVSIAYRPIDEDGNPTGGGGWTNGLTFSLSSTTKEPMRVTRSITKPLGNYEFMIQRSAKPDANEKRRDQIALTAIRSIAFRKPVADETLSLIEFAIRATALNQGTLAPITCRIKPLCPTWDAGAGAWTAPQPTSNPAALTRWLLSGPAPVRPEAPERVDVGLRAWSELCETYDWTSHVYLTELKTQAEAMALLEQAGRASLFWDGTQIVASPWVEKASPVQLFAGDNLRDHKWTMTYVEPVHALRVEFQNLDEAGEPDELYVYADGYAETAGGGKEAAVLIEALRVEGQKTQERAYRDGRWELGRRLHQRRVDTWACDIEQLASRYGSRVRLAWQRVDSGASARVRVRRWSGGLVSGLRLTQPVTMVPGESYAVDLRLVDGVDAAVPVINEASVEPVTTRDIAFAAPRAEFAAPRGGDLVAFGIAAKVSEDVEIIGIEPGEGLTATLTGVRYVAPLLMAGETGPIPELQTRLSRERAASPPAPRLLGVQPDPSGVRVSFEMPPWSGSSIAGFSARWRPTPAEGTETGWVSLQALGRSAMTLVTPPIRALPVAPDDVEGRTLIDVEVRAYTEAGQSSPQPLLVTAIEVRDDPWPPVELTVTPAVRQGDDGASHGVLHVSALPLAVADGVDMIVEVRREPVEGEPGAWEPASKPLPAANPQGDLLGLLTGERYRTRAAWRSAGGWPSPWADGGLATVPANSNVASDSVNVGGEPTEEVKGRITDAQDAAQDAIDAALEVGEGLALVPGLIGNAVGPLELAIDTVEEDIHDPETGLIVRVGDAEVAAEELAQRVGVVESGINTPDTGLFAQVADLQQGVVALDQGKANATDLTVVRAAASGAGWINRDPYFLEYPAHLNTPTYWGADGTGWARHSRQIGANGELVYRQSPVAGENVYSATLTEPGSFREGQWVVVEADIILVAGSLQGSGVYLPIYNDAGSAVLQQFSFPFSTSPDTSGVAPGAGVTGARYRFRFPPVQITVGGASRAYLYPMSSWAGFPLGTTGLIAKTLDFYSLGVRAATRAEIEVGKALAGGQTLQAQFSALVDADADLNEGKASVTSVQQLQARGGGGNLLRKAQWFTPETPYGSFGPWVPGGNIPEQAIYVHPNAAYGPGGGELCVVAVSPSGGGGYSQILSENIPAPAGQRLCHQTRAVGAGCNAYTFLVAYDAAGAYLGEGGYASTAYTGDVGSLNSWPLIHGFYTTPPGTASVRQVLRREASLVAGGYSVGWFLRPMVSVATPTQTEPPPWSGSASEAQLVELGEVSADLYERTLARWALGPSVPGASALIFAQAESVPGQPPTSSAGIGADVVALYVPALDTDGDRTAGWSPVLTAYPGGILINGNLQATAQILLGTGQGWPLARGSKSFAVQHNVQLTFPTPLGSVPRLDWVMDNLLPRNAGEEYVLGGSLTANGFLPTILIAVPATPSQVTLTVDTVPGTGPTRQIERGANGEAPSGNYTVSITGTHTGTYFDGADGEFIEYGGSASATVYARKAGAWQVVGSLSATTSGSANGTGFNKPRPFTIGWSATETIQMGSGVEAFGVSFGGQTGGNGGSVTDLVQVTWTAQGAGSGTRAALAPGTSTTVRITPQ